MIDKVLLEIMANKPNKVYQAWLKNGREPVEPDQNKRVSKLIDSLNSKLQDDFIQQTFDFD